MLARHHPLRVNTYFNHPAEITASSTEALARLADAGIPPGNQSVLLAGVNDCPRIMKTLCRNSSGTASAPATSTSATSRGTHPFPHPGLQRDRDHREPHRGHTSGFAVPTYVIDAPEGGGRSR